MSKLLKYAAVSCLTVLLTGMFGNVNAKAAPSAQSTLPAEVLRTEWTLQYFNTDAKAADKDVTSSKITINFDAIGTLSGFGGCNNYSGAYSVSGQKLTISDKLTSTMMACPEPAMSNESLYLRLLPTVTSYVLNGSSLDLIYADGHNAMTFIPGAGRDASAGQGDRGASSGLPDEVLGKEWTLQYFNSNARVAEDLPSVGVNITFAADGTLSGYSGCNTYSGSYRVSGQQITIGQNLVTTRMVCPASQSTVEGRYLKLLPTVTRYDLTAGELQLAYAEDGAALVYTSAGAPQVGVQPAAAMPNTGGGLPLIAALLLAGSLVAIGTGSLLNKTGREERARRQS